MKILAFVLGLSIVLGSCGVWTHGVVTNTTGDGYEPRSTLTSTLLGYKRGASCEMDFDDRGRREWQCPFFSNVSHSSTPSPLAAFFVKFMFWPLEMMIGFLLMLWAAVSRDREVTSETPGVSRT